MIGLPCDIPNHASYLDTWIAVLKQDRREIFHAVAEAQRMADYILGFHPDYAETPSESSDAEGEGATSMPLCSRPEPGGAKARSLRTRTIGARPR
jgi:Zincin-like metallopeptidase